MNLDLTGKKAIVCGSTQGIGKAVAKELAQMGASVILVARNTESLQKTKEELDASKGQEHDFVSADFSFPEDLKVKLESYIATRGPIDILVNNTGGPPGGPIVNAKTDEFLSAFNNHLVCNHVMVQAVVEGMKSNCFGRIINVISTSVKQPLKGLGVSNTIRAAVANWAKTLSLELAPFGITVNNVLPGATNTVRLSSLIEAKSKKTGHSEEYLREEMLAEIPAGRFAEAFEIANAVAFLASPAAAYINGINIPVDGGRTGNL
jgi:3-oxoacyl-[acyl-carrier protein] reductase